MPVRLLQFLGAREGLEELHLLITTPPRFLTKEVISLPTLRYLHLSIRHPLKPSEFERDFFQLCRCPNLRHLSLNAATILLPLTKYGD